MEADKNRLIREIFANALEKTDATGRAAYLAEACGPDAELRALVESLLRSHQQSAKFMEAIEVKSDESGESPGTVIGRYKLLQRIGEGGFGRVYMAEQQEPVRRKVALKIIKLGMDTREVIARFEAERQALALMDHPNVAQVLDGGATDTGRPYFVMELVKGIPITDYCDQQNLPTGERLQLFLKVCHAVQHAHQKGVIHRDLKPSNILVTEHDGEPVPKVIDFGVAKAIGQPLTDKTLFTRFEQMIGTPAYMSPEQAGLGSLDVDTRTDIYALGVLLYELLTGTTPVRRETLHQAALEEVRRMIRETEPPKPSTRLHTLGKKLNEVAQHRHTEPSALQKLVRGDLDWIVMKALEKDRQRRYESAGAFSLDIERYLNHEPVTACPPSRMYRARRFVRRHRVGVGMAAAVTTALLLGLTASIIGFTQARRERERTKSEAAIAQAVNEFLQKDLLAQADPYNEPDRDLKLRAALDRAAAKVQSRFTNQPLVEVSVRLSLAGTYLGLGEYSSAQSHAQRAVDLRTKLLGPEHPDTLEARRVLGSVFLGQDKVEAAEGLWQAIGEISRRVMGEKHTNTLNALSGLSSVYLNQGRYTEAERVLRGLIQTYRSLLGSDHPKTLESMNQLALVYVTSDRPDQAAEMTLQALEAMDKSLGLKHPARLTLMGNLAEFYNRLGRLEEAINLAEQVVSNKRVVLGGSHPETILSEGFLANYYGQGCRWQQCAALCREIVDSRKDDWPDTYMRSARTFLFQGAVASVLAGDLASYRSFASELSNLTRGTTNHHQARTVLEIDCLVPDIVTNGAPYIQLADLVRPNALAPESEGTDSLALGMLEFRRGRWDEALRWFEKPRRSGYSPFASQAAYFAAMIHHQRGQPDLARAAMEQANRRFAAPLRCGLSGAFHWHEFGRAAVTRVEAERMILGRTVSELPTPAAVAAAHQAWAPVHQRFLQAQRFAMEGNWLEARDAYVQAMAEPVFEWEAAEAGESWLLSPKVGAVLLRAQDWTNRRRLCEQMSAHLETLSDERWAKLYARIVLAATNGLPSELIRKAIGWAYQGQDTRDAFFATTAGNRFVGSLGAPAFSYEADLFGLAAGMASYREGEYQKALTSLATNPNPRALGNAGMVLAFRSMSLFQLGRRAEALEVLQQAENLLAKPLQSLTGDRWYRLLFAQVALEEARATIAQNQQSP